MQMLGGCDEPQVKLRLLCTGRQDYISIRYTPQPLTCTLSLNLPFSLLVHGARAILIRLLLVVGVVLADGG